MWRAIAAVTLSSVLMVNSVGPALADEVNPQDIIVYSEVTLTFDEGTLAANGDIQRWSVDGVVPLTSGPAYEIDAQVSPDGTQVLYTSDAAGDFDLYVMDIDGSNQVQLTNSSGFDSWGRWSVDGAEILFARAGSDAAFDLAIMNADGSNVRMLTNTPGFSEAMAAWSPDGSKIVFVSDEDGDMDILSMNADGTNVVPLTDNGFDDQYPSYSPDGRRIAFSSEPNGNEDVFVMDADGSSVVQLTQHADDDAEPTWSPDGRTVLFGSNRDSAGRLYVIGADGTGLELFPAEEAFGLALPHWWGPTPRFFDARWNHTFHGDINWLADEAITLGCNPPQNDLFCPDQPVTRGQMAAFLHRSLGDSIPETLTPINFVDDDGSVFAESIGWLSATGITKGCNPPDNTMFCPDDPVTRGQMAAFLVRAMGYSDDGGGDLFQDDDDSIFAAAIDRLATAGVTRGCNPPVNDAFCPSANVTRAQMAAFLYRALG